MPLAVELRHRDWLDTKHREATMKFLDEHRLSYVCVDVPPGFPSSLPPLTVATTDLAVVRFHGRNGDAWERGVDTGDDRIDYDYRRGELEPWGSRLAKLAGTGEVGARAVHHRPRRRRPRATPGCLSASSPRNRARAPRPRSPKQPPRRRRCPPRR